MIFRVNPASGVPIYLQLMEQIKHSIETGALHVDDQLPAIRKVAEEMVINPNTVARAYRELEHEGVIELKHGSGAYVSQSAGGKGAVIRKAQLIMQSAIERLRALGLSEEQMRRSMENELAQLAGKADRVKGAGHE